MSKRPPDYTAYPRKSILPSKYRDLFLKWDVVDFLFNMTVYAEELKCNKGMTLNVRNLSLLL
jgi:hypothetical protein